MGNLAVMNARLSSYEKSAPRKLQIDRTPIHIQEIDWYWMCRAFITNCIDEEPFRAIYRTKKRIPVASIRLLAAMTLVQESFGWDDKRLMTECQKNYKVRYALGLNNFSDEIPLIFVYNDFRNLVEEHADLTGIDLTEQMIDSLVTEDSPVMKLDNHSVAIWTLNIA